MAESYPHGTAATIRKRKCRCEECRAYMREYQRRYRAGVRVDRPVGIQVHGLNGYLHHRCRCEVCTKAHTDNLRAYRQRRRLREASNQDTRPHS